MKGHPYSSEKVSPQCLGRFATFLICIFLFGLLACQGQAQKQIKRPRQAKTNPSPPEDKARQKIEHIPPPIIIADGSLELEFNRDLQHDLQTGPRPHTYRPRNGVRLIEGVRILTEAGETLFPNPPSICEGCQIQIWLKKPIDLDDPQIVIKEAEGFFVMEIDKELMPSPGNTSGDCLETSYKPKRCKKFTYLGDIGSEYEPIIEHVRILIKDRTERFNKDINSPDHYHGCRVLIWWR